ncbi:MAG: protein-disulfide reductase DsbD N-terminal domain-containing protein, partial [Pseudomonadota bacterium]|nr:protein-disulfide reductase DsbD N-terminal domain-containing protein [Pseudomonadota bacterium]
MATAPLRLAPATFFSALCFGALLNMPLAGFAASAARDAASAPAASPFNVASPLQSTPGVASSGPIDTVKGWLTGSPTQTELLPPDEAYRLSIRAKDADTLVATLTPADGYYLYRDRIKFAIEDPPGITVAGVSLPNGEMKADPNFGDTDVYHHPFEAVIRLARGSSEASSIRVHATYQGCNE